MKDPSTGSNLLHEAADLARKADDARYFVVLTQLGFPLYEEDGRGDFAAFLVASIKGDGVFAEAFSALSKAGFDVVRASSCQ